MFIQLERSVFLKLNQAMALRHLVEIAQHIDRHWPQPSKLDYLGTLCQWAGEHSGPILRELTASNRLWQSQAISYEHFLAILVPIERAYSRGVVDADILINTQDKAFDRELHRWPLQVICDNLRSAFNVGSIFRTADCLGLEKIYLCGYTASPEHDKTRKAALGAEAFMDWEWQAHSLNLVQDLKAKGYPVIALETVADAPTIYEKKWQQPSVLLMGNERHGLPSKLLTEVDEVCRIPVYGYKNSLNIATAFAITAAEIVRQWTNKD